MYVLYLALNSTQGLICHKSKKTNKQKTKKKQPDLLMIIFSGDTWRLKF